MLYSTKPFDHSEPRALARRRISRGIGQGLGRVGGCQGIG